MRTTEELRGAIRASADPSLLSDSVFTPPDITFYLCGLLEERGWLVKDAIRACYLERSYGYQLFNGTRAPTRTFLLRLALALGLSEEETQRLLTRGGKAVLYPRSRFDAAVLYGLSHHLTLEETDELLLSLGEVGLL